MNIESVKKASRGGGCTEAEYRFLLDQIRQNWRILIFGLGYDSSLYLQYLTPLSEIVFIEDSQRWINKISKKLSPDEREHRKCSVVKVQYNTEVKRFDEQILNVSRQLFHRLEAYENFDFIFVDAPKGCNESSPGRLESIYTASLIGKQAGGLVMVHDIDRRIEQECCKRFLEPFCKYKLEITEMGCSWIYKL